MDPKANPNEPTKAGQPPKRRFRLEKLEDRIAPKKGGNGTKKCLTDSCDSQSTGTSGY
jgi:hypothetical protein